MSVLHRFCAKRLGGWFSDEGNPQRLPNPFRGAEWTRLTDDWILQPISPDQEVERALWNIRARSRDLVRNNGYAKRFVRLLQRNVVGPRGIQLQARVAQSDGTLRENINAQIEDRWSMWGHKTTCSVDGRSSLVDIENAVIRGVAEDGEAMVRIVENFENPFRFALQVVDPDLLDHRFDRVASPQNGEIRQGVEMDRWGRPIFYHLLTSHPADFGHDADRRRVPAGDYLHIYVPHRKGAVRGVPWFAPVIMKLKMHDGYEEAVLVQARVAAAKGILFEQEAETEVLEDEPESTERFSMEVEPGLSEVLPPGLKPHFWDPQYPQPQYRDFTRAILQGVAAGLDTSYMSLANDLTQTSFASGRMGWIEERDAWRSLQEFLSEHLLREIYLRWLRVQLMIGGLRFDSRDPQRFQAHLWRGRGWDYMDPTKDIEAKTKAIAAGLDSRTRCAGDRGMEYEDLVDDLAREERIAQERGVNISVRDAPQAPTPSTNGRNRLNSVVERGYE